MEMWRSIVVLISILFLIKVEDSQAVSSRNCFREGSVCNPLYLCPCCPKLYFEDGTNGGLGTNVGYFCNMDNAQMYLESTYPDPYPQGCCQKCTSEGDGCTSPESPCCPDQSAVRDPSCPDGQTMCQRKNTDDTLVDADHIPRECSGRMPECYGEGQHCSGSFYSCCEGLYCGGRTDLTLSDSWGICTRNESFTGDLVAPTPRPEPPGIPTAESCWNFGLEKIVPPTPEPSPNCLGVGAMCDQGGDCCAGLVCPILAPWWDTFQPTSWNGWIPSWAKQCEMPRCYEDGEECNLSSTFAISKPCCSGYCSPVNGYLSFSKGVCKTLWL